MTATPLRDLITGRYGLARGRLQISLRRLGRGFESEVARVRSRATFAPLHNGSSSKRVSGRCRRESTMYQLLRVTTQPSLTPTLFGVDGSGQLEQLCLEDVHPSAAWPWADIGLSGPVCRALAALHRLDLDGSRLAAWDYDLELRRSAEQAMHLALTVTNSMGERCWKRVGDLRRVVRALPCMRTRLRRQGTVVIHGDVHPGNVLVRKDPQGSRIVLIDWGRARYGSPLEDLASWLQSVGCWEPEARRRHDSLFRAYLQAYDSSLEFSGTREPYIGTPPRAMASPARSGTTLRCWAIRNQPIRRTRRRG